MLPLWVLVYRKLMYVKAVTFGFRSRFKKEKRLYKKAAKWIQHFLGKEKGQYSYAVIFP